MKTSFLTPQEYWEIERNHETKWELWNGHAHEMTDFSRNHVCISGNVLCSLGNQLRGQQCEPFVSLQRYKIPATGNYFYPDCSVICPPLVYDEHVPNTLCNPKVLIEVLAPSTTEKDRGVKWAEYQTLESLIDYVLISQNERRIEHYSRAQNGDWIYRILENEGEVLLASIDCTLNLADVYERVGI